MSGAVEATAIMRRSSSMPAETRKSLSQQMSALGARLGRVVQTDEDRASTTTTTTVTLVDGGDTPASDTRSLSRGRETFQSSGRGGIGNIRPSSQSRDTRPIDGPDDFSVTRGREPAVHPDKVYSVGRGGVGNIRSPSRGPSLPRSTPAEAEYEHRVIEQHAEAATLHSSGRGGAGNISDTRSRSRGPAIYHSTGRGGTGNMQLGDSVNPDILDIEERRKHPHPEGIHSTGRGGAANITTSHGPEIERVSHHIGEFESSGRGGAGNIRSRSGSRDPSGRAQSKEKHGIAALFDKVTHPHHTQSTEHVHSEGTPQHD